MLLLDVVQWGCSLPVACLTVLVEVEGEGLLVGGGAAPVRVGSPVASTVIVLMVVLGSVQMYEIWGSHCAKVAQYRVTSLPAFSQHPHLVQV